MSGTNEINGWGTFTTLAGPTLDVISFTGGELLGDDPIDTTTNSNGTSSGGIRSMEPGQFTAIGNTIFTVYHSAENKLAYQSLINVKDTGTLTSKSGATESGEGWPLRYTEDESSPTDKRTASMEWVSYTGDKGQTLPTITPSV